MLPPDRLPSGGRPNPSHPAENPGRGEPPSGGTPAAASSRPFPGEPADPPANGALRKIPAGVERRACPRFPLLTIVDVQERLFLRWGAAFEGRLADLSLTGARILLARPVGEGGRVRLLIPPRTIGNYAHGVLRLNSRVIWCRRREGSPFWATGLEFTRLALAEHKLIHDYTLHRAVDRMEGALGPERKAEG